MYRHVVAERVRVVANSEKSNAATHPVQPDAKAARSTESRRRGTSDGINRPRATVYGRTSCGHTARARRPAARCAASGARQTQAHLASVRGRRRRRRRAYRAATAASRLRAPRAHRVDVSTSASPPLPARSAAAEPPGARAMRAQPAGTCDAPRVEPGLPNDTARPAGSRTPRASTHEGSLEAAARLPVRPARGIHVRICKQQHRDAS